MPPSSSSSQPAPLTIDRWLRQQMVRAPIRFVDRYLVGVRWAGILLLTVPGLLFKSESFHAPSLLILAGIVAYNIVLSIYSWQQLPMARGHVILPLLGDTLQFVLLTLAAGGHHSFYFIFALLAALEIAMGYRWKMALIGVVLLAGLQLGMELALAAQPLPEFSAYLIVMKFILILLVGAFAIAFSELLRREEQLRLEMSRAAERVAELNTLLMRLGESALDTGQVLQTILESIHTVPGIRHSMALSWQPRENCWQVVASTHSRIDPGDCLDTFSVESEDNVYFAAGEGTQSLTPLPNFVDDPHIRRVSGVYLRSPEGELLGMLMFGRDQADPLPREDLAFLQSLAMEAGLALRNARLYTQEQEHVARLERFQSVQRTYFSAMSHELKTPLAVLKMLIPSLSQWDDMPPETRREIQESLENNLRRLETMIQDSLESDRLEAGGVVLNRRAVSIRQMIDIAYENLAPLLDRKQLRWEDAIPDDLPPVWADPSRLDRVLENLLGNAVKFSPEGGRVRITASRDAQKFVRICVEDQGPGVPPSERPHVFDRFYTTASQDEALKGVGLGLFIARSLVELHGGRIWVEDAPDRGSRFCFTLPIISSPEDSDEISSEAHSDH